MNQHPRPFNLKPSGIRGREFYKVSEGNALQAPFLTTKQGIVKRHHLKMAA